MAALFGGIKDVDFDFSYDLRDRRDWKIATIREAEYLSDISALAVEPTNGLVAVGTKRGKIVVFGAPPTAIVLRVPRAAQVRFLRFSSLVYRLLCVDDKRTLHVWDLSQLGRPKIVASETLKEPICSITVSHSHSHAFIGLERGAILAYDILCLHRSPYIIPDLWKSHERDMLHSGLSMSPTPNSSDLMDIVIHPRDLNLLFIAYTGGVVLFNLTDRQALHHYKLIIPPGAPGALGYYDPEVMQTRQPALTSIAIHASGQLFATGHLDGSIALWAVDDEDHPLMVRTIDKLDINYPDGEELDTALSDVQHSSPEVIDSMRLEPIFKLSWCSFGSQALSDPYSSDTVLIILGGYSAAHVPGLTALRFPAFALISPSTAAVQEGVRPEVRKPLAKSFSSGDSYLYSTVGVVTDYLSIPKGSPLFGGDFDPVAILIVSEWPAGQRSIESKEFPPPSFGISQATVTPVPEASTGKETDDLLNAELSSTLKSLKLNGDPKDYTQSLPAALWTGLNAVCDGDIVRLENEEYERLQLGLQTSSSREYVNIGRAGIAWVDYGDHDQAQDLLFTKRQPHRLLVTHHRNLTVCFQDITAQLLLGSASSPLSTPFPAPLPHLTIELSLLCSEPCVSSARHPLILSQAEIQSAQLTSESCECVVVMNSGHVIVYSFDERQRNISDFVSKEDDIVRLSHIFADACTFQPMFMTECTWGRVTACELSNIGFLAIAYSTGTLIIVDMRHPKIILRDQGDVKVQKRISVALHLHNSEDARRIVSLKWFVCGFDEGMRFQISCLSVNSYYAIFKMQPRESASKNGTSRAASRDTFKEALQGNEISTYIRDRKEKDEYVHCFWVSAGEKGVKCHTNFVGSKVGKTEWRKDRKIESVEVVTRNGAQGLVAIMDTREVVVYSLPALEELHVFQLNKQPNSAICLDDTGDFVDWTFDLQTETVCGATLGTLFAIRRVYDEPVIDYTAGRRGVPSLPPRVPLAPVSYIGSWFNFKKSLSGDAVDTLLAGPNRPIPEDASTSSVVNSQWQSQMQSRAQALANQASRTGLDLYASLSTAVSERGDVLAGLDEHVRYLGDGGNKMVSEAKKLAAEQTGKRWFRF
ncbi:hypothetical protein EW145_g567 [Phellinidium pouzarii]|uniref:Lethal giant larvae (Lgl)-like C-terminal domain-containing protein n=1 Tax=Phellinidium pouzarii TaxID=167371 RepID=A0A4S4LI64_9AGAM|nr:hypothetical protein EW145_g567 [Phellinidium pouzarii]